MFWAFAPKRYKDRNIFGFDSTFCGDCLGIVGVFLFAIIWKASADGYAKADKLLEQVKADYAAQRKKRLPFL